MQMGVKETSKIYQQSVVKRLLITLLKNQMVGISMPVYYTIWLSWFSCINCMQLGTGYAILRGKKDEKKERSHPQKKQNAAKQSKTGTTETT